MVFPGLEVLKDVIKKSPATTLFLGLIILSFIGSYLFGNGPTDLETARLFGSITPADATTDNLIRTVTYTFHQIGGPIHLLLNLSAIVFTGPFLEKVYGPFKYTVFFLVTGIFGGLFVLVFSESNIIVGGASGSAYGLIGLYVGLVLKKSPWIDLSTKNWVMNLLWINIVWTFFVPGISIAGHMGGLISGIIIAMCTPVKFTVVGTWWGDFVKSVLAYVIVIGLVLIPKGQYPNLELPFIQDLRLKVGNESAFAIQPIFHNEFIYSSLIKDKLNFIPEEIAFQNKIDEAIVTHQQDKTDKAVATHQQNKTETLYGYDDEEIPRAVTEDYFDNIYSGKWYLSEYGGFYTVAQIFNNDWFSDLFVEVRSKSVFISGYYTGEIMPDKDSYLEFILIPEGSRYLKVHKILYDGQVIDSKNEQGIYSILGVITTPLQAEPSETIMVDVPAATAVEILQNNGYIPKGYDVIFYGIRGDRYVFHVYEDKGVYSLTHNWYYVNIYTGEVETTL